MNKSLLMTESLKIDGIEVNDSGPTVAMPPGINWRWNWLEMLIRMHGWTTGAELGVKEGRTSFYLLSRNPNLSMISVDLWDVQEGNDQKAGGESYATWDNEGYYQNFNASMKRFGSRSMIYRMFTNEAAPLVTDNSLDFVFIDADHSYDGVKNDIIDWYPKVKDTGMVIGHDLSWNTVSTAIDDTLGLTNVIKGWNNCWGVWKKDIVEVKS